MVDLAGAGAVLSGLGSVGGLFGKKKKGPSLQEQYALAFGHQKNLWEAQLPSLVKGAQTVGLHPLVAAGVNPASSSVNVGTVGDTGDSFAGRLDNLGQNISRAASAYQSKDERAVTDTANALKLENMKLQNDILRGQVTTINRANTPPIAGNATGSLQGAEYRDVAPPNPKLQIDAGMRWQPTPNVSNGEDFETRYGEIGGSAAGLGVLASDIVYNLSRKDKKRGSLRRAFNKQHISY